MDPKFGNPVRGKIGRLNHPDAESGYFVSQVYRDGVHDGLDITRKDGRGDPVLAIGDGKVTRRVTRVDGGAKVVRITHTGPGMAGWSSGYGHLDSFNVEHGDTVVRGKKIGTLGNTGHTTGPHLHFDITKGRDRRDPWPLLEQNHVGGTVPVPTRATPTEDEFMPLPLRERFEHVTVPKNTKFFTDGPGVGPEKKFTIEVKLQSVAVSVDGKWRLVRFQNASNAPRELLYIRSRSIKPKSANGEPTYDAKVVAAIKS